MGDTPPSLVLALLAAGFGALAACGLTADFSGLQGGTRDAGGASGAVDASPADGGAAAALDAGSDAATDAHFCASRSPAPQLCADFDEGMPVDTGWAPVDTSPHATVKVDSIGFSPPGSMLSAITPADVPAIARLRAPVPLKAASVHVEFELLLPTGGGPFELCAIHETAPDGTDYGLFYKEEQGRLLVYVGTLEGDGGLDQFVYPLGAPPAQWLHVAIDFGLGDPGTVTVKHDGATVINASIPTATAGASALFVALGFYSANGATARADFDDVVVDWPPPAP